MQHLLSLSNKQQSPPSVFQKSAIYHWSADRMAIRYQEVECIAECDGDQDDSVKRRYVRSTIYSVANKARWAAIKEAKAPVMGK